VCDARLVYDFESLKQMLAEHVKPKQEPLPKVAGLDFITALEKKHIAQTHATVLAKLIPPLTPTKKQATNTATKPGYRSRAALNNMLKTHPQDVCESCLCEPTILARLLEKFQIIEQTVVNYLTSFVHNRGCTLGGNLKFFKSRESVVLGVWTAPGASVASSLGRGASPPPF